MVKGELPSDLQLHSRVYTQDDESLCPHKNPYTNVYSGTIHNSQKWKQPKFSPTEERRNEMWYLHTVECCSVINKNKARIHATWMNLGSMLSKRNQTCLGQVAQLVSVVSIHGGCGFHPQSGHTQSQPMYAKLSGTAN